MGIKDKLHSKAPKKILHLIDSTGPGGAETVFVQLVDKMRNRGFESIVVIQGSGWLEDELIKRGIKPYIIPAKGSFAFNFLYQLVKLIFKHRVRLIQSHLLGSNVYAAITGLLTRVPVVATYHGMVDVSPNERFKILKNLAMKMGITRYVAVSQSLLESIREQKLLDTNKACVIYNGVDLQRFEGPPKEGVRVTLKLLEDTLLVGCLGNIRPAKAYHVLIEAAALLIPKYPQLHFIIAGHKNASLMGKLNVQMEQLGIQNHFHFIGFIQESAAFLKQMDNFVLCSSSEGFSIATIEAMAAKLPIVVTRCGGPEEIVTSGESGLMAEPDNAESLAYELTRYLEDSELKNKLAQAGYEHVKQVFSLEKMLDKYDTLYNTILL